MRTYLLIFVRSLKLAVISTAICLLMGYPFALLISRASARTQGILITLIMIPMWMNFLIRTYAWMTILQDTGILNGLLGALHLGRIHIIGTEGAVVIGMVYDYFPYMILPIYSVMAKMDVKLIEAARDLGCSGAGVLRRVIWPLSLPGVISGVEMVLIPSISTFYISQKLGNGKFYLIGDAIESQYVANNLHFAAAIAFILMLVLLVGMALLQRMANRLVMLFLFAPIAILLVFSFNGAKSLSVFSGFSLHWYEELFRDSETLGAVKNTLILAVSAALISTVMGTAAAVGIHRLRNRYLRLALDTATNIPMINPDIITGISLMLMFVFVGRLFGAATSLNFGTMLIAHVTFCLPYVILQVLPKLQQMDQALPEAAMDLGCTPLRAFLKVEIPEIFPGVLTGLIMAFTLSLDDFVISYFTSGNGFQTLPIRIYNMTKKTVTPKMYALATIIFFVILAMLLLSNLLDANTAQTVKEAREKKKARK